MKPIHHTFGPLADGRQVRLAMKLKLMPWRYRDDNAVKQFEEDLGKKLHGTAITFSSGRESLLALLKAWKLQPGEEVIVQGYTCVVVPNAIHAAGMNVVYADIEKDTLNLDVDAVEKAITPKTRVIICQHTFGIPSDTKRLRALCDKHSLLLLEDCAHVLPDNDGPEEIGTHGDAMLLSFGRDKAVSGVTGGAVVVRDTKTASELQDMQQRASHFSLLHIAILLKYPLLYAIARPLYGIDIGKGLLFVASKLKLLVPILTSNEKRGVMQSTLHRMPGACAVLAHDQLNRLQAINDHRRHLTALYLEESKKRGWPLLKSIRKNYPLQKFPMFLKGAEGIRKKLKKYNIHLHDGWTGCVICPEAADEEAAGYKDGMDPSAESACEQIFSLPTHPTMTDAQAHRLIELLDPLIHP